MQKLGTLFQHFRTFLILADSREAAYVDSVCQQLGEADQRILVDKFSVAKHLGEAVDQVRRKKQVIVSTTH
jgi:Transposase